MKELKRKDERGISVRMRGISVRMKGKCSHCKANKPIYKRGDGVYCGECLTLEKSYDEHIGIGNRFVDNGARGKSCKKGNRAQKSKHQMRTSLGMTWNWNS